MDYDGKFIMQKTVDWSLLNDGMTIPVSACALLKAWDESILTHGVSKDIKVLIDGEFYGAMKVLYASDTYRKLENETTKMWHLGPVALYEEIMAGIEKK